MSASNVVPLFDPRRASRPPAVAREDDAALAIGLRSGQSWAERALVERHTAHVERILTRILGGGSDVEDLTQEVFLRALDRVEGLRDPSALRGWLTSFAVFVAREAIRKRRRKRWLVFLPAEQTPEVEVTAASPEARAALRAFYDVVGRLDADARIVFTLRFVEGMELTEIAEASGVSLATVKRRLRDAQDRFLEQARDSDLLTTFLEEGTRWPRSRT